MATYKLLADKECDNSEHEHNDINSTNRATYTLSANQKWNEHGCNGINSTDRATYILSAHQKWNEHGCNDINSTDRATYILSAHQKWNEHGYNDIHFQTEQLTRCQHTRNEMSMDVMTSTPRQCNLQPVSTPEMKWAWMWWHQLHTQSNLHAVSTPEMKWAWM